VALRGCFEEPGHLFDSGRDPARQREPVEQGPGQLPSFFALGRELMDIDLHGRHTAIRDLTQVRPGLRVGEQADAAEMVVGDSSDDLCGIDRLDSDLVGEVVATQRGPEDLALASSQVDGLDGPTTHTGLGDQHGDLGHSSADMQRTAIGRQPPQQGASPFETGFEQLAAALLPFGFAIFVEVDGAERTPVDRVEHAPAQDLATLPGKRVALHAPHCASLAAASSRRYGQEKIPVL